MVVGSLNSGHAIVCASFREIGWPLVVNQAAIFVWLPGSGAGRESMMTVETLPDGTERFVTKGGVVILRSRQGVNYATAIDE